MKRKRKIHAKQLFCFTGLPLAGKTHAARIIAANIPNSIHISTGDIARSLIKDDIQQKEMEAKDLFPGELELRTELKRQIEDSTATYILVDGFPRFGAQAEYMANTFNDLFPMVIDVNAGDMRTLAVRARERNRDNRDAYEAEFIKRLGLAMCNHNDVDIVVRRRLIPTYTIMSTGDEQSVINQFMRIAEI
jgi:adenylate kinase family enzyme